MVGVRLSEYSKNRKEGLTISKSVSTEEKRIRLVYGSSMCREVWNKLMFLNEYIRWYKEFNIEILKEIECGYNG